MKKDNSPLVAYISMEIALDSRLPSYAGGLGVLAGDILRSAAALDINMVGVSLLSRYGYLQQELNRRGKQLSQPESQAPTGLLKRVSKVVTVNIGQRQVRVSAWRYSLNNGRKKLPIFFLDCDLPENAPEFRHLTDRLYGGDQAHRLRQEIILGRGGVRMLKALGYKVSRYHLNEGHGALAAIELMLGGGARSIAQVRRQVVFTNHTLVAGGNDIFPRFEFLNDQPDWPASLDGLFQRESISMTYLGAYLSGRRNGVSEAHRTLLCKAWLEFSWEAVTNGVNSVFWTSPSIRTLYDKYLPGWRKNPTILMQAQKIPPSSFFQARARAKSALLEEIYNLTGKKLNPEVFTIGVARRFSSYKRLDLILSDLERLGAIAKNIGPLQIIFSGKAHPSDSDGLEMLSSVCNKLKSLPKDVTAVFIPNYNLESAKLLVSGVDLWLNNPVPYNEASGTSGMKAAHNGVLQASTMDGWWAEAFPKFKSGWKIYSNTRPGADKVAANSLYGLLEREIMPCFYRHPELWRRKAQATIAAYAPVYNSDRVLRDYCRKLYRI